MSTLEREGVCGTVYWSDRDGGLRFRKFLIHVNMRSCVHAKHIGSQNLKHPRDANGFCKDFSSFARLAGCRDCTMDGTETAVT